MIGIGIKRLRKYRGFNQKDFAKKLKTTASYLSEVETGTKTPSLDFIKRIAKKLDVPYEAIAWYGIQNKDVHKSKREVFDTIKPAVDSLMEQLFSIKPLN